MLKFFRKAIIIIFSMAVFAVIVLCALYALGFIYGANIKQVNKKEYAAGELSYTYTGMLVDGKLNGIGEIIFSSGDRYTGGLEAWRFNGDGVFHSADGWFYEGEFSEGQFCKGKLYGANDDILTQDSDGLSEFVSTDGWIYSGSFNEWGQSGTGKFTFADGAVYEGEFVRGLAEGHGFYQSPEGWSYNGNFHLGVFHGEGMITQKDGKQFRVSSHE